MDAVLNSPLATTLLGWRLRRRQASSVAVLCYHGIRANRQRDGALPFETLHVRASTFAAHCRVLARYCHPVSLECWREARAGGRPLPARAVAVTFDDGYRSVLTEALPILVRYQVPAAVFLVTRPIQEGALFWYDALARERGEGAVDRLKHVPYEVWKCETAPYAQRADAGDPLAPLAVCDVAELARHPLVEIGGHTENHPILARAPLDVQAAEVAACTRSIEEWIGRAPKAFAYPNGRPGLDLTADTRDVVAAAGIDLAFTTGERAAAADGDPLLLPRITVTAGMTAAHLLRRLERMWS